MSNRWQKCKLSCGIITEVTSAEYTHNNRKLNFTFYVHVGLFITKLYVLRHTWSLSSVTNCRPFSGPSFHWSVTYFTDGRHFAAIDVGPTLTFPLGTDEYNTLLKYKLCWLLSHDKVFARPSCLSQNDGAKTAALKLWRPHVLAWLSARTPAFESQILTGRQSHLSTGCRN